MYNERQKGVAKAVMHNVWPIAIMMGLLMIASICFLRAESLAADNETRWLLLIIHGLITIIQGTMVALLFWSRKVVRSGQGKL